MCMNNQTQVTQFVLMGFGGLDNLKILLVSLFLLIYSVILTGNILIIVLVSTTEQLKAPMFYFLKHLAFTDVLLTTNVIPLMLDVIIMEERIISVNACLAQLFFFGVSGGVQCFLLAVMSYDRCVAIRNPLNYTLVMSPRVCLSLVASCWILLLTLLTSEMVFICRLQFCGHNYINHFFCDFGPLVSLTSSDTSVLMLLDTFISIPLMFVPFIFIIISYILIFFSILGIRSVSGRRKFFSTCSTHLATVCTYYVTMIVVYMAPPEEAYLHVNKLRSLLYIVGTPLMNPIIYSLRNKEIRGTLKKIIVYFSIKH